MSLVNINIDHIAMCVDAQATILEAAQQAGIRIPSLCHHPDYAVKALCRVCMVEAGGKPVPACATKVSEGMRVKTQGEKIESIRKTSLELILSHHPMECQHCARNGASEVTDLSDEMCGYCRFCDCVKDGVCELQDLAREMNVTFGDFTWTERCEEQDSSTASILKDPNKCILCRRCIGACNEQQEIHAWSVVQRGEKTRIAPPFGETLSESNCVQCGQCVRDCPTGALIARPQADDLYTITDDKDITVIACIDPNFLPEFSKLGGYKELDITERHVVAGLHRVGVEFVWQGVEMSQLSLRELLNELDASTDTDQPLIGWSSYAAQMLALRLLPDGNLSHSRSAQLQFNHIAKGEWAEKNQKGRKRIYTIMLTASISGKAEAAANSHSVDLVLTPVEVKRLFHRRGADLSLLPPEEYDRVSVNTNTSGMQPDKRGVEELVWKENRLIAVVQGLDHARRLLEEAKTGTSPYDLIYLSALPGESIEIKVAAQSLLTV